MTPPSDIEPARLFRLLLARAPHLPIPTRLAGVEHPTLCAFAIHPSEANEAIDAAHGLSGQQFTDAVNIGIVARSLRVNGSRVFRSSEDVTYLPDSEIEALVASVTKALATIGPLYAFCDWEAWHRVLEEGARDPSNSTAARLLGSAYDVGGGIAKPRLIDRPDRYWHLPTAELLDGHLMIYRAARKIHEEHMA